MVFLSTFCVPVFQLCLGFLTFFSYHHHSCGCEDGERGVLSSPWPLPSRAHSVLTHERGWVQIPRCHPVFSYVCHPHMGMLDCPQRWLVFTSVERVQASVGWGHGAAQYPAVHLTPPEGRIQVSEEAGSRYLAFPFMVQPVIRGIACI